jgi:hypothetical protein
LTPDQLAALDAAKAIYAPTGWEIQPSGEVLGAPEGVSYNVDKGVLTRTYIYEGIELTVDLTINTETPMPEGCIANFEGWCLTQEKELARKTYSTAGGYGYEGDGKVGEPLLSRVEAQAILADETKVDMNTREFNKRELMGRYRGDNGLNYGEIAEPGSEFGWATNKVPVSDEKGEIFLKDTTVYLAFELENPVTYIQYWGADHAVDKTVRPKIIFLDTGEPVPDDVETKHPSGWHWIYGPVSEGGQNIAVEW